MSSLQNSQSKPVIEQVTNNTTSWIGQRTDKKEVLCGQTFVSPAEGELDSIEVFSSIVTKPGKAVMTVHHFDLHHKTWGPPVGSASVELNHTLTGKWVRFQIAGMHLHKGQSYGFKLESPNTYFGIGEAAASYHSPPVHNGQKWQFVKNEQPGNAYSYFSLAFKIGLRA